VNDQANEPVLSVLADLGVKLIALRAAGYNNVDLKAAHANGIAVARVPAYSPHAVAEHTFALLLCLARKIHRAYNRVREGNFALHGLLGYDLFGKTIGIVGVGKIGENVARIALGFGCKVVAFDEVRRPDVSALGVTYVSLNELLTSADIISLHCPLTAGTRHLIDADALAKMKPGTLLINTSRGAVVDTPAVIDALKSGRLGGLGIDVYEQEESLFFEDRDARAEAIMDDVFARLTTFPNVLITGHQGFFTMEAMTNIATTTVANLDAYETSGHGLHEVKWEPPVAAAAPTPSLVT
jgi:D-lactate dehydrogenase